MTDFMKGIRDNAPLVPSVVAYSCVLGVLAAQKSILWTDMMALNVIMFAGSAQFVLVDMWNAPLPVWEMVLAAFVVNLRYMLIGASLKDLFSNETMARRFGIMHFVADENWAMTMAAARRGKISVFHLLGGGMFFMAVWSAGTMTGLFLGSAIPAPQLFALDFAFTAVFTALAVSLWRGRQDRLPWLVAIAAAILTERLVPGKWYILSGGMCGAICAGLLPAPEQDEAGETA